MCPLQLYKVYKTSELRCDRSWLHKVHVGTCTIYLNDGVRVEVQGSGDPCVLCSNPTVGCRSFAGDRINRGPVLK
jgi:hypothetical protein